MVDRIASEGLPELVETLRRIEEYYRPVTHTNTYRQIPIATQTIQVDVRPTEVSPPFPLILYGE
jgi:hypothetical protein